MRWHVVISAQPTEQRHPRRQAWIRETDPGFNAPQRPALSEGKAHPRTTAGSAHLRCESSPASLHAISAISAIILAVASVPMRFWGWPTHRALHAGADRHLLPLTYPRPGLVITTRNG
jgi:hypothetical protein